MNTTELTQSTVGPRLFEFIFTFRSPSHAPSQNQPCRPHLPFLSTSQPHPDASCRPVGLCGIIKHIYLTVMALAKTPRPCSALSAIMEESAQPNSSNSRLKIRRITPLPRQSLFKRSKGAFHRFWLRLKPRKPTTTQSAVGPRYDPGWPEVCLCQLLRSSQG